MALRVLIVPDKFKGTLTAAEAAEAIARGWRRRRPHDALELLPMSDGGDGFGEVLSQLMGATPRLTATVDAARRPTPATWWWQEQTAVAIVETARIVGLAQLPKGAFHPFALDTAGLGAVFREARELGAKSCLIGIGGSATNDGGFGLARSLGWRFLGKADEVLERWIDLERLERVCPPADGRWFKDVLAAVDVQNPLLGPTGCTRIYGPQKGLRPEEFEEAERSLGRLAEVLAETTGRDVAREPGAGAAGGLGFGLRCFLNARLESGFELFAERARLSERLREADLVISGEGSIDASSLMGKGVGEVARRARELGLPCLGFAGVVGDRDVLRTVFTDVWALAPEFVPTEQALREPAASLEALAELPASQWPLDPSTR